MVISSIFLASTFVLCIILSDSYVCFSDGNNIICTLFSGFFFSRINRSDKFSGWYFNCSNRIKNFGSQKYKSNKYATLSYCSHFTTNINFILLNLLLCHHEGIYFQSLRNLKNRYNLFPFLAQNQLLHNSHRIIYFHFLGESTSSSGVSFDAERFSIFLKPINALLIAKVLPRIIHKKLPVLYSP